MELKKLIYKKARELYPRLVEIRRHLHRNPELSYEEEKTSAYVRSVLDAHGIKYKSGYCKHGIVAEIKGAGKGKIVYLRGDMDALPIKETSDHDYVSTVEGVMHACGHDVHTTCVLGSALILNELKDHIKGRVRIVFQPGEERLPGGASIMIKEGAITNVKSSVMYGQHVHPPLEVGKVGFHPGEYMASADELFIEVTGKGGHAALPQDCVDTILVASQIVVGLHHLVSRYANPLVPTVVSIGKINSDGGATNIIPEKVHMMGTMRSMDEENRFKLHEDMKRFCRNTARAYGAKAKLTIKVGYPTLKNNPDLVEMSMDFAREYLGEDNVVYLPKRMTAEDFAYFSQMMPCCFFRLGTGNEARGIVHPVHTSRFDVDEKALEVGTGLMTYMAIRKLQS